jgi:hypothetical protein
VEGFLADPRVKKEQKELSQYGMRIIGMSTRSTETTIETEWIAQVDGKKVIDELKKNGWEVMKPARNMGGFRQVRLQKRV